MLDDVQLARRYPRVRTLAGGDAVRFRMYPNGFRQLVEGWSKNIAAGAGTATPLGLLATVAWIAALILAPFAHPLGYVGAAASVAIANAAGRSLPPADGRPVPLAVAGFPRDLRVVGGAAGDETAGAVAGPGAARVTDVAAAVAIDVVAWAVISAGAGYVAHRLPAERFRGDGWLTRRRTHETTRVYERHLRIKRWKDRLPEAGALFRGGFSKRAITGADATHLERFVVETRRAEHVHWWILASAPLFLLWNPWWLGLCMLAYAVATNVPCIAVQRYNRLRLRRALGRVSPTAPRSTDRGSPPVPS